MARWDEIERDAAEFAAKVRARFDAGTNKTIATLRRDGAPRISATEAKFQDGEITFGMMPGSRKLQDVRRDPRIALHSPTIEPPPDAPGAWPGDAKQAGTAVEIEAPGGDQAEAAGFFRVDITEVTLVWVDMTVEELVVESWHEGRGHTTHRRK